MKISDKVHLMGDLCSYFGVPDLLYEQFGSLSLNGIWFTELEVLKDYISQSTYWEQPLTKSQMIFYNDLFVYVVDFKDRIIMERRRPMDTFDYLTVFYERVIPIINRLQKNEN